MLFPASFAVVSFSMLTPPWNSFHSMTWVSSSLFLAGSSVHGRLTNARSQLLIDQKFLGWFT